MLIGGLAAGAPGFPRATKDLDIVPAPDTSNLERLAAVLGRLDVMQWVPGVPGGLAQKHLARSAIKTTLGVHALRVCSKEDLTAMRRAAARPQDLVDVQELGAGLSDDHGR